MLIFVLLSTLFTTSSKEIRADEESASLLKHGKGESNDIKASVGKSSYGSITITADGQGADLEYEAEQRKKDEERMKGLEKRLEAEGSWVEYGSRPKNPLSHLAFPSIIAQPVNRRYSRNTPWAFS